MPDDVVDDAEVGLRTPKDAARYLAVSLWQLYRLHRSGHIEMIKIGRRGSRITQQSLDRFIANAKRLHPQRRG